MRSGPAVEEENGEVNLSRYIIIYNIYNISTLGVPLLGLPPAGGAGVPPPGRHAGLHLEHLPRHLRNQGEHWISGHYPQHLDIPRYRYRYPQCLSYCGWLPGLSGGAELTEAEEQLVVVGAHMRGVTNYNTHQVT